MQSQDQQTADLESVVVLFTTKGILGVLCQKSGSTGTVYTLIQHQFW